MTAKELADAANEAKERVGRGAKPPLEMGDLLDLRDGLAAFAMMGFLVGSVVCGREIGDGPKIARTAYAMADAMLIERQRSAP